MPMCHNDARLSPIQKQLTNSQFIPCRGPHFVAIEPQAGVVLQYTSSSAHTQHLERIIQLEQLAWINMTREDIDMMIESSIDESKEPKQCRLCNNNSKFNMNIISNDNEFRACADCAYLAHYWIYDISIATCHLGNILHIFANGDTFISFNGGLSCYYATNLLNLFQQHKTITTLPIIYSPDTIQFPLHSCLFDERKAPVFNVHLQMQCFNDRLVCDNCAVAVRACAYHVIYKWWQITVICGHIVDIARTICHLMAINKSHFWSNFTQLLSQ